MNLMKQHRNQYLQPVPTKNGANQSMSSGYCDDEETSDHYTL